MAYNTAVAAVQSSVSAASDAWRAKAFVNVYLPKSDGSKSKVGKGIALTGNSTFEKALLERLSEEGAIEAFAQNVIIEVHFVDNDASKIDLGF